MFDFDHGNLPKSLSSLFFRCKDSVRNRNLCNKHKNKLYTSHRFNNRHGYNILWHHQVTRFVAAQISPVILVLALVLSLEYGGLLVIYILYSTR